MRKRDYDLTYRSSLGDYKVRDWKYKFQDCHFCGSNSGWERVIRNSVKCLGCGVIGIWSGEEVIVIE